MKHRNCIFLWSSTTRGAALLLIVLQLGGLSVLVLGSSLSQAESKRIIVYPLSQNFIDTHSGDTLSDIAARLVPENVNLQQTLMADILSLNPDAFINHSPDHLLANKRLWLPNHYNSMRSNAESDNYRVESFSWGTVKRPR